MSHVVLSSGIAAAYTVTDEHMTATFLATHPELIDLLNGALEPLRRAFPQSHFTVRVDEGSSPPTEGRQEILLVIIWTKEEPMEVLDCLNSFYDDWWIAHYAAAGGRLRFDVGFE